MAKGFKLKDGSIWTIISYTSIEDYIDKDDRNVFPSNVLDVTGVKWEKDREHTHPYRACFSYCNFETFKVDDPLLESISSNVFEYTL